MTLDDINVIFCAVDVEVGERFVYREQKAEENEIEMKSPSSVLRYRRRGQGGKSAGCGLAAVDMT